MPERSFFDLRYAVPGYTFISLIFGINYICFFSKTGLQFDIFLAALSVFGGSALGFLIFQVWWVFYQLGGAECRSDPRTTNALINNFELPRPNCRQDRMKIILVSDYVIHHKTQKEDRIFSYMERRWDIYHLLSSELFALPLGWLFGMILRLWLWRNVYPLEDIEVLPIVITSASAFFLLILVFYGRRWVQFQHDIISTTIVNSSNLKKSQLAEKFPPHILDFAIGEQEAAELEKAGISKYSGLAKANIEELSKKSGISKKQLKEWISKAKAFMEKRDRVRPAPTGPTGL